ncbi:MAG: EamA family transporter [Burkholderiaceae bacterium]
MPTAALYAVCVLVWGTTWFAITAQIAAVAPEVGVAVRFGLAAAALLGWCGLRGIGLRFTGRQQGLFALQGLSGLCAAYICIYHAERFVVSGVVAVGYAASPLIGLVTARLFLGTPMSRRVALGGTLGLVGVALIFSHEFARVEGAAGVAAGAALTAAAVLLSSVSTTVAARYQREGISGWAPLAWAMAYGSAGSAIVAWLAGRSWQIAWGGAFVASLAYLTLAGSVVAFGAFYALVHRIGPARAGYIGVMTPVVALVVSSLLEGFAWSAQTLLGVALAIVGQAVAVWPARQPAESSTTTGA